MGERVREMPVARAAPMAPHPAPGSTTSRSVTSPTTQCRGSSSSTSATLSTRFTTTPMQPSRKGVTVSPRPWKAKSSMGAKNRKGMNRISVRRYSVPATTTSPRPPMAYSRSGASHHSRAARGRATFTARASPRARVRAAAGRWPAPKRRAMSDWVPRASARMNPKFVIITNMNRPMALVAAGPCRPRNHASLMW